MVGRSWAGAGYSLGRCWAVLGQVLGRAGDRCWAGQDIGQMLGRGPDPEHLGAKFEDLFQAGSQDPLWEPFGINFGPFWKHFLYNFGTILAWFLDI